MRPRVIRLESHLRQRFPRLESIVFLQQSAKRDEDLLLAQYFVTKVLAEAPSLQEAAPQILKSICETLEWAVGTVWKLDKKEGVLRCVETWHIPTADVTEFSALTRSYTFDRGIGLPGRVWQEVDALWIEDLTRDPNFPRAPIATSEVKVNVEL